jgi:NADPH-dependent glutamate synthase beta subunit-like oxidoreductase
MPAILVHIPPAAPLLNGQPRLEQMSRMQQDLAAAQQAKLSQVNGSAPKMLLRRLASQTRKPRVAIVGAGFAGLRAADVLLRHGVGVTIFEARDRVGGRVCHDYFPNHVPEDC